MKVLTTVGLKEMSELDVRDSVTWEKNARYVTTEYRFNGELVKRDICPSTLRTPDMDRPENEGKVFTTRGLVDLKTVRIEDIVFVEDNARVVATEWYLDGIAEYVRRDVTASGLRPLEIGSAQTQFT